MTRTTTQSTPDVKQERRAFRMHKDMLYSIIKSQAGTVGKAITELVMNSLDAGATKVEIRICSQQVTVSDDGKGFASRQEIEEFFETFGTPHDKGDATYGRFRMGRGQIMAFARNAWRSGEFSMRVDIRDKGLEYDLVTEPVLHKGCRIEATLYEPLPPSEVMRVKDHLREMCAFTPVPVFVNDEQVSTDPATQRWTFEDDDAYYLLRDHARELKAFNLGVFVRGYWKGDFGIGGTVVSKRQLEVNFARNDILVGECQVWKRIASRLRAHARQNELRRPAQNESYRQHTMQRLLAGAYDDAPALVQDLTDAKLFTDYSGKHLTLEALRRAVAQACETLVTPDEFSAKADIVHTGKLAVVLSPGMFERTNGMPLGQVLDRLRENIRELCGGMQKLLDRFPTTLTTISDLKQSIRPLAEVAGAVNDSFRPIPDKDLSKEERVMLKTVRDLQNGYLRLDGQPREIRVCESDVIEACTDGARVIHLNRKLLKAGGYMGELFAAVERIRAVLVHEYCHEIDSSTGHGHPAEFYELFHEKIIEPGRAHRFGYEAVRMYLALRRQAGLPFRIGDRSALDLVGGIDAADQPPADEEAGERTVEQAGEQAVEQAAEAAGDQPEAALPAARGKAPAGSPEPSKGQGKAQRPPPSDVFTGPRPRRVPAGQMSIV